LLFCSPAHPHDIKAFFFAFFFYKTIFMVYLVHFQTKLHHAQHYIGFVASDLMQHIELHRMGRGAKLLAALVHFID
jgi:hypothetical protein